MAKYITNFKTQKEVGNDFYTLLANVSCKCGSKHLIIIKNERSDASYQYLVDCQKCQKTLGKIDWNEEFVSN